MTQRIHSLTRFDAHRRALKARNESFQAAAAAEPPGVMDRAWSVGYMAVSLLAIGAACAIAGGEAAKAELRFATVALHAAPLPQDLCFADRNRYAGLANPACAGTAARGSHASAVC